MNIYVKGIHYFTIIDVKFDMELMHGKIASGTDLPYH